MIVDLATQLWPVASMQRRELTLSAVETEMDYAFAPDTLESLLTRVILYNDDHHTFDEVILQVCKAVGCSEFEGEAIAWEVHTRGRALVFEGELFECLKVSSVLEEIALFTQVLT